MSYISYCQTSKSHEESACDHLEANMAPQSCLPQECDILYAAPEAWHGNRHQLRVLGHG